MIDPGQHGAGGIIGRGEALVQLDPAIAEEDEVSERAADIDAEDSRQFPVSSCQSGRSNQ
jgi:hypothetical protein